MDRAGIEVVNIDDFREMQGILGSFYVSMAMFNVTIRLRKQLQTNLDNDAALGDEA